MELAFIFIVIFIVFALVFFFVAGIMWKSKEPGAIFASLITGLLGIVLSFFVFYVSVRNDIRAETKTIILQTLEKDNKVDIQISKSYDNLIYTLTDSTLTNTFDYLRSNK